MAISKQEADFLKRLQGLQAVGDVETGRTVEVELSAMLPDPQRQQADRDTHSRDKARAEQADKLEKRITDARANGDEKAAAVLDATNRNAEATYSDKVWQSVRQKAAEVYGKDSPLADRASELSASASAERDALNEEIRGRNAGTFSAETYTLDLAPPGAGMAPGGRSGGVSIAAAPEHVQPNRAGFKRAANADQRAGGKPDEKQPQPEKRQAAASPLQRVATPDQKETAEKGRPTLAPTTTAGQHQDNKLQRATASNRAMKEETKDMQARSYDLDGRNAYLMRVVKGARSDDTQTALAVETDLNDDMRKQYGPDLIDDKPMPADRTDAQIWQAVEGKARVLGHANVAEEAAARRADPEAYRPVERPADAAQGKAVAANMRDQGWHQPPSLGYSPEALTEAKRYESALVATLPPAQQEQAKRQIEARDNDLDRRRRELSRSADLTASPARMEAAVQHLQAQDAAATWRGIARLEADPDRKASASQIAAGADKEAGRYDFAMQRLPDAQAHEKRLLEMSDPETRKAGLARIEQRDATLAYSLEQIDKNPRLDEAAKANLSEKRRNEHAAEVWGNIATLDPRTAEAAKAARYADDLSSRTREQRQERAAQQSAPAPIPSSRLQQAARPQADKLAGKTDQEKAPDQDKGSRLAASRRGSMMSATAPLTAAEVEQERGR